MDNCFGEKEMEWVPSVPLKELRDFGSKVGWKCIEVDDKKKVCTYFHSTVIELGSPESVELMTSGRIKGFAVGCWGDYEIQLFTLVREKSGTWYAHRDDCQKMCKLWPLDDLDYGMVNKLYKKFRQINELTGIPTRRQM